MQMIDNKTDIYYFINLFESYDGILITTPWLLKQCISDYYTDKLSPIPYWKDFICSMGNVTLTKVLTYHRLHQFMFNVHWHQNGGMGLN